MARQGRTAGREPSEGTQRGNPTDHNKLGQNPSEASEGCGAQPGMMRVSIWEHRERWHPFDGAGGTCSRSALEALSRRTLSRLSATKLGAFFN